MMSITKLDNEYASFLKAQALMDDKAIVTMEVTCSTPLKKFVDPQKLQSRLDRFSEIKYLPEETQYLNLMGLKESFLDSLIHPLPEAKVMGKAIGNEMKIRVTGTKSELILWEMPISVQIHDLYFRGLFELNELEANAVVIEGVRRFQVKLDTLRGSGVRFIEAGSRYRYSYEWYALLLPVIMGDARDLFLGTTNLQTALAYGLKAYAPLEEDALISSDKTWVSTVWPEDQAVPVSTPLSNRLHVRVELASVREIEKMFDQLVGKSLYVADVNAYEMGHLYSHFGDQLIFEWGSNLTADMGPAGGPLRLEFKNI